MKELHMHLEFTARKCSSVITYLGAVILLVIVVVAGPASAADVTSTWNVATSGDWNLNANWTNVPALGGFPNNGNSGVATYDAVVSAVGSPYNIALGTSVTLEDLTLNSANATVNHTAGTFAATGAIGLAAGTYQLNGGTLSNTTVNVTGGTLAFVSSAANLLNGVTVNGDLTLNTVNARTKIADGTTFTTAHLAGQNATVGFAPGQTLASTILFEGASSARYVEMNGSAGTLTVGSTGVIRTVAGLGTDVQIGGIFWYGGAMTLVNQGLISSQTSGRTVTVIPATLTNSSTGILEATGGGTLTIDAPNWSNAGNLRALSSSTANLNGAWSNLGGMITADATSTLNFGGSFTTPNLGTLSLAAGSKVNIVGAWDNSGQSFTLNAATGSWTVNGGSISGGTLGFANGQALLFTPNAANVLSGVTVNGDLTLNSTDARTKIAGGTTFTTAHLGAQNAALGFAPGQTLAGTILFEGANHARYVEMNGSAGTFTVGPTGVIRTAAGFGGDVQIGSNVRYAGAMTLINEGLISSQSSGRTVTVKPAMLTNSATGVLEAKDGGTLAVPLGYTQSAGVTRVSAQGTISAVDPILVNTLNTITIAGGRLEGNGTVNAKVVSSGTIAPGLAGGALAITADLTLNGTSALQIEMNGVAPGSDHGLLTEAGAVALNLAGVLSVTLTEGFVPGAADTLVVLSSNQPITGMFSNVVGGHVLATDGITSLPVSIVGNHLVIAELPGDYNGDQSVNAADYTVWRNGLGGSFIRAHYEVWKGNYGATSLGSGASAPTSVPEPTFPFMLTVVCSVMGLVRHRRRRVVGRRDPV